MIKWTTPTLRCYIDEGLTFDYLIFTLKSNTSLVEKTFQFDEIQKETIEGENVAYFDVTLEQEETGGIVGSNCEAQLNIMSGDSRLATNIIQLSVSKNLHNEVIE